MERFWKWLRNFSNEKVKECYLNRVHHDRLCTKCNTWTSEVAGCAALEHSECGWYEYMTCNKCGHVSKWDCRGMIPGPVEEEE